LASFQQTERQKTKNETKEGATLKSAQIPNTNTKLKTGKKKKKERKKEKENSTFNLQKETNVSLSSFLHTDPSAFC